MALKYGEWSTTKLFTLDTQVSPAPVVDPIPAQSLGSPITVTGTGEPGATVEIWLGTSVDNLTASGLTAVVQPDGTWSVSNVPLNLSEATFIGAKQTDISNNVSPISNIQSTQMDAVAPTAAISLSPAYAAYGLNETITVTLTASEPLQAIPTLSFTPNGQTPIPVTLVAVPEGSQTVFQGTIVIQASYAEGTAVFAYSGVDLASNVGTTITSGGSFVIDKVAPYITINPGTLITNDTTRVFSGEVSDGTSGVSIVKIALNGGIQLTCNVSGGIWTSPEIAFFEGVNEIVATAYDSAGLHGNFATASASIVHNVLPYAPYFTGAENPAASNDATPTFVFVIPADPDDALDETTTVHLWLQVARDALFTIDVANYRSRDSQAGWRIGTAADGTGGVAMPVAGTNLYGAFASFTLPVGLTLDGDYYWRVCATDNVVG